MESAAFWQIGFGLGELPIGGSFKPSITIGYHFNDKIYAGIVYQLEDAIQRDNNSFNVKSSDLEGLLRSTEDVARRFMFQARYKPFENGPYLAGGFVYNGRDTETMRFDERARLIAGEEYSGGIAIQQTRPAGWGLAFGIGYQYDFDNGFSAGFEWTPAWFQYPEPEYAFSGAAELSEAAKNSLMNKMDADFESNVTNLYKVFHIGVAYRIQ